EIFRFRLSAGDLEESKVEYTRYNNELTTISRFYAEALAFGKQVSKWKNDFKKSQLYYLLDQKPEYTNYSSNRRIPDSLSVLAYYAKGTRTPPHQIIENKLSLNPQKSQTGKASVELLLRYFGEFVPLFEKYKEQEKHNVYSCANDDVMDIRDDSGFAKFLPIDQYTKRNAVLPESCCRIIEEYYMESLTEGGPKKIISDWVRIINALILDKVEDTEEVKRLKKIESFLKPVPDISAPESTEHHYWSDFGHHFSLRLCKNLQDWIDERKFRFK
ncbi:1863_t:CDS:2, partial [Acaulospora colombiana]